MNHRASLSVRLLAGQLALAVLLVAAIVVVTTEITRQLLYDEVETQWWNVIGLLQNTLNAEPALFTQGKLHALFHPFADRTPGVARFSAVDHTLTVIEDSDNAREGLPTDQATLIRVIEQGRGETFIYRRGGITYLRLSEPIFGKYDPVRKSNVVGAIALDISLAAADRRVSGVLFNIGGLAALVLAVFFTVQYFLTRRAVFTPLNRLSAQALAIGRGDWETPIEVRRIDEIGRLAAALEAARLNLTEQAAKRDQIQASLLDANQTLRTLIAASPLAIASFDLDNHVRLWNPAAERLLGWRRSEAVGQRLPIIPESEGERFYAAREKVARGESVAQLEFTLQRKDGSPVEVSVSASPVRDAQGSIIGLLTMAVDVTERKQAEARLRQQSAALEAAANAIVITDREGIIQWVNPAFTRLTGYAPPEAAGQTPRLLKSGAHDAAFFRAMWETILAGQEWHGEIVNRRKDGSLYTEEETITPVRDGSGAISHFVAIKQDITDRKQAEAAVQKANAELAALLFEQERKTREAEVLSELSSFMQSCLTTDEIYSTFGQFARRLFPGRRGAFYRLHPSRDWLDAAMTWEGDTASAQALPPAFAPDDCWALRRGRAYRLEAAGAALPCAHVEAASGGCEPRPYVCIPLLAHGEALGSLYVESGEAALLQFGEAVADHLALALANMRLRESLAKK